MLSITSEYALRALIVLAREERTMQARELATETKVPASYLSKILSTLRRKGILEGARGIRGGYSLAGDPGEICLLDVVRLFELVRPEDSCILGREGGCDDAEPCSAHDAWQKVTRAYTEFLTSRTLADMAADHGRPGRT